jgi:hypothetical protein
MHLIQIFLVFYHCLTAISMQSTEIVESYLKEFDYMNKSYSDNELNIQPDNI